MEFKLRLGCLPIKGGDGGITTTWRQETCHSLATGKSQSGTKNQIGCGCVRRDFRS
jgi:hypothetical protein